MQVLELRSLRKSYFHGSPEAAKRTDALVGVDLTVDHGEILGIVGNEGAGKTTLLLCAAGLLRRDAGNISWFGEKFPGGGCVPGVLYVPSSPTYYPFITARDVLQYYGAHGASNLSRAKRVRETAWRLSLSDFLSTQVKHLERETVQRLAIAQAIVDEPLVLLVDGALDMLGSGATIVHRVLRRAAANGMTIIATTRHADCLAPVATRIVVLDGGRITGSFASLKSVTDEPFFDYSPPPLRQIAERVH
jgi:ABC-type multidrug transport system ATPase subunit